jgi:drug/metabolite transporter (DMT)-like permease
LLVLDRSSGGFRLELGLVLVAGATFGWAIDNTLSRALSSWTRGKSSPGRTARCIARIRHCPRVS